MIQRLLNTQTKSVGFASVILAFFYVVSASLGLLRDHLLAGKFGAGNELDVYYAAFTVPDFIALILVFGAISAAIIPIFTSYLSKSENEAWEYASNLLNIFLVCLVAVCGVLIMFAPFFVKFIAPGFSAEKQATCAMLMRIMFLSPIILGTSNIMSGILQVFHRFLVTALAPVMYNIGIITGIVIFVPWFGLMGLAYGVVLGGLLHMAIQIPALMYSGFSYKRIFTFKHQGVIRTLKLMIPRSLGLGAGQINTIATTAIASTLVAGSVAVFNLSNNLSNMLINAMAVSLSTALFPSLALAYLQESKAEFQRKFSTAFLQLLFLTIPAGVLLFLLRAQLARVVWGSGKFDWTDTRLGAACLGVFAFGLCFQGLIFLLSKTFYAAHNTKIPAIASVVTVVFNIFLSFSLVRVLNAHGILFSAVESWLKLEGIGNLSVVGLALAFSITGFCEALLLLALLYKNYQTFRLSVILPAIAKILLAATAMAVVTLLVRQGLIIFHIVELQTFVGVFIQLAISALAGGLTYLGCAYLLGLQELRAIVKPLVKRFTKQ